ncbi:MAG: Ig-like domain-containing protein, partial [Candidatus Methylomirabilis sp.]|nr:Ig-like domain-containing protein [Deltaproteobacteria bacterium]
MAGRGKFIPACLLWSACAATPAFAFVLSDAIAELKSTRLETGGTQAQALTILDYVVRPRLITSTPANGASSEPPIFAVTLNLSAPTAPGNLTSGSVQLEAGGVVVTADLDQSEDGDTITITPDAAFIDEIFLNVIAGVAVRALLDEDTLVDPLGFPIDADGDGVAGGQGVLAFNTARLARYEGTVLGKTFSVANVFQPPLAILPVGDGVNFAAFARIVSIFNEIQPTVDEL